MADIPSNPESRPFANPRESTCFPSALGSRLDMDHNNLGHSKPAGDNTLDNKQQEVLPKRVGER